MTLDVRLDDAFRADALARLREGVDVLVIGGGVTGNGVALDAALRGLRVGLVEQRDFASGTSSRSSKLVHGGLRYLEQFNFSLVREALRERSLLLDRLAPHLVVPLPFLYPLSHRLWERPYVGAGLTLYDTLGGLAPSVPRHSHLSKTASLRAFPDLRPEILAGSIRYHDAQVDDARHTLELARTAAAHGAAITASTRVTEFIGDGERVSGAVIHDSLSGASFPVKAGVVVNATGVWAGATEQLAGVEDPIRMRPSKGVHLVVPRERINGSLALITRTPTSVLFVLPWGRSWIIGTTDTAWHEPLSHPVATATDVSYLLEQANNSLSSNLTADDVIGAYAGLRPLVDHEGQTESEISREHTIRRPIPGLVTIAGGKYTTYRVMAEDTVDALSEDLGELAPSRSNDVPLLGAADPAETFSELRGHAGARLIDDEHLTRLCHRYGRLTGELLDLVEHRPDLAQEVPNGAGTLAAEIVHATTHEGALHIDDALTRRTRLYLEAGDRGLVAARHVARLMGDLLHWTDEQRSEEVSRYQRRVAAEIEAESVTDDQAAAAIRNRVPDIRLSDQQPSTGQSAGMELS